MPTHSYKCKDCEHKFEVFYTSIKKVDEEEPSEPCPKCTSVKKERQICMGSGFILKGRGWAKDRYGS